MLTEKDAIGDRACSSNIVGHVDRSSNSVNFVTISSVTFCSSSPTLILSSLSFLFCFLFSFIFYHYSSTPQFYFYVSSSTFSLADKAL